MLEGSCEEQYSSRQVKVIKSDSVAGLEPIKASRISIIFSRLVKNVEYARATHLSTIKAALKSKEFDPVTFAICPP